MNLVIDFISTFLISICEVIAWRNLTKIKFKILSIKNISIIIILTLLNLINYHFTNNFIKAIGTMFISIMIIKLITKLEAKKCIVLSFITELLVVVAEAIIVLLLTIVFGVKIQSILESQYIILIDDICIGFLLTIISKLKLICKFYNYLNNVTCHIKKYQIIMFCSFVLLVSSSIYTTTYFKNNLYITLIINIIISISYTIVFVVEFRYQDKYYNFYSKYNTSLDNLHAQELIINEYRVLNHENINNLNTIKNMTNNKKIIGYVNSLLKYKSNFTKEIMDYTMKLPEGGIRGLIYSKILYMKENGVEYYFNIDKKITSKMLGILNDNDIVDICQILGVFIDNAIEESQISSTEVIIDIHFSLEKLTFKISNNYTNNYTNNNLRKIDEKHGIKTTKGKNRGNGLILVKRIVDSNKKLQNERIIGEGVFTQILSVEI